MASRWILLLLSVTACGEVLHLGEPVVDISPAPAPRTDLTCVITTPAMGGSGPITYSASWQRDGMAYTGTPTTTMFANDTVPAVDVAPGVNYECTVTATDGVETVTVSAPAVMIPPCATGGMAMFAANGSPPNGTAQEFIVPPSVCRITIEAGGAEGGFTGTMGATFGAKIIGTVDVFPHSTLRILVGQQAGLSSGQQRLSGGGGTFVIGPGNKPLVIAGGGGSNFAGTIVPAESVGRSVTSGGTAGASARVDNGAGGNSVAGSQSGAGGGFLASGGGPGGGAGYNLGGTGGGTEASGGYGGGGGRTGGFGEGGGGGYSGGSCGDTASAWVGCGGGGSLNAGMNPSNTAGAVTGNGYAKITW